MNADGGQGLELLDEDAFGFAGLVDVDVVPLALAELGEVLDEARLPVEADAHHGQVDLLLVQPAAASSRHSCSPEVSPSVRTTTCDSLPGAGELLDFVEGQPHAVVHGRAARIDVEHVDLADDVLDLGSSRRSCVGGSRTRQLWAKATMVSVSSA